MSYYSFLFVIANEDLEMRKIKKQHSRKLIELKMETELIEQQAQLNRAKKLALGDQHNGIQNRSSYQHMPIAGNYPPQQDGRVQVSYYRWNVM